MQVVDAEPHHIEQVLSGQVRQVDIDEWVLGSGMKFQYVLRERLDLETQYVRALLDDGGICICLWGAVPFETHPDCGNVWLIGTTDVEAIGKRVHRFWPEEVGRMHMRHPHLFALAYANNELHLRWLQQIGFMETQRAPVGPGAVPFVLYRRDASCVIQ